MAALKSMPVSPCDLLTPSVRRSFEMNSLLRLCCLSLAALASAAANGQQVSAIDQAEVVDAMRTMYVAATNDDLALFHAVAAPDFYAFELGKRFTGDELMALLKSRHDAGVVYVWRIQFLHSTRVP
jgi:hypothetical protein